MSQSNPARSARPARASTGARRIALLACAALCLLALLPAAEGKPRRKKGPVLPPQVVLGNTLNERRDDIQRCAIDHALAKGASRADIVTMVTINSRGQVVDSRVTVNITGGDGEQVRTCVEGVLRGIKFPSFDAPLIHIERTWTVSAS